MWNIVQCAVQGRGHIKEQMPCQDKTFSLFKKGVNVVALADGAGSAKMSHFGAAHITEFICYDFCDNFDVYFNENEGVLVKKELISKILIQLSELSKDLNCEINDLASTLLFVAIKDSKFIIAHIGDGVVGYLKNDQLKIASQPENGEFTNTTVFTTSKDALMTMKIMKGYIGGIDGFILMSDGTEASLYNKKEKKLASVLKKIMNLCVTVSTEKIEEQLKESFKTTISMATMDDCSIALVVKDSNNFKGYNRLSNKEKMKILEINSLSTTKKKLNRYNQILNELKNEKKIEEISKIIHLKPKYTKKYLKKLLMLNFIERKGVKYRTILLLNK